MKGSNLEICLYKNHIDLLRKELERKSHLHYHFR
jgi:hypothetical protein